MMKFLVLMEKKIKVLIWKKIKKEEDNKNKMTNQHLVMVNYLSGKSLKKILKESK